MRCLTVMFMLSWLVITFMSSCSDNSQVKASEKVMSIPTIKLLNLDSTSIVISDSIANGKPVIFMFFESDCHMCQEEVSVILNNAPISKDWKILLISRQPLDSIRNFARRNNLFELDQIAAYKDPGFIFFETFKMKSIPSTVIYGSKGELRKRWEGQIDILQIKEILEKKPA